MAYLYHAPSSGAYSWVLTTHQNAASMLSSLISVCGLIAVYILLNLVNNASQEEDASSSQRDFVTEYLLNKKGDVSPEEVSYCAFLLSVLPKSSNHRSQEGFAQLINLLISFGLGLIILVVLSSITLICYPRRQDSENFEQRRNSRGYRLLSLGLMLRRYHVRLKAEDARENDSGETGNTGQPPSWMIPKAGIPNDDTTEQPRRRLMDICPICLETYNLNEKVAYSSNPNCVHAFHESCILAWMLPQASTNQQCPCCRQPFLSCCSDITKKVY